MELRKAAWEPAENVPCEPVRDWLVPLGLGDQDRLDYEAVTNRAEGFAVGSAWIRSSFAETMYPWTAVSFDECTKRRAAARTRARQRISDMDTQENSTDIMASFRKQRLCLKSEPRRTGSLTSHLNMD